MSELSALTAAIRLGSNHVPRASAAEHQRTTICFSSNHFLGAGAGERRCGIPGLGVAERGARSDERSGDG